MSWSVLWSATRLCCAGASDSDPDTTSPVRPGHLQADLAVGGRSGGLAGSESQISSSVGRGCRYLHRPSKKRQRSAAAHLHK